MKPQELDLKHSLWDAGAVLIDTALWEGGEGEAKQPRVHPLLMWWLCQAVPCSPCSAVCKQRDLLPLCKSILFSYT